MPTVPRSLCSTPRCSYLDRVKQQFMTEYEGELAISERAALREPIHQANLCTLAQSTISS